MKNKTDSELIRGSLPEAFSLWDLPSFDAEPLQVPLESSEPEPIEDIQDIAEPEDDIEQPRPFTVDELEQIREEAYNEGFSTGEKDGFHAGQLKGQQEARVKTEARLGEIEGLMAQLMDPMKDQDDQVEDMLLKLVETMVRQVIQRELKTDSSQIVHVLRGALKALPMGAGNIRIYLNPADFEAVKALRERHEESWRLLEDEDLMAGGCRIETEHSQVDATLETRLNMIIDQLFEARREQRAHPPEPDITVLPPSAAPSLAATDKDDV
ncbi:MAG TPA: flagellar assembly protein FliH [Pseudomonas xinjiangensis]|uniref:Flagellar assembly protein FliH n=2 Tax=root TaxID=1 RepID=A0A7V1FQX6_9GAMM|nr:flagellar assembly protein FliH [Halopseudomonas xinjiangensis]HEC49138.1 flagellar assembly protein FliH [Halopseudomonas xinjiangensis]